eukprot:scaffold36428_cov69-Phaeocystis_antarctica.AAC.1
MRSRIVMTVGRSETHTHFNSILRGTLRTQAFASCIASVSIRWRLMTKAIALRVRPPAIYERPKLPHRHEAALISAAGAKRANPGQAARHIARAKPPELKCRPAKPLALRMDQRSHSN